MKRTYTCPKCGHNRILYIANVADSYSKEAAAGGFMPARIAVVPTASILGMPVRDGYGELEAGVCRQCGYVEMYVKDPASIPVDGTYVQELVGQQR